MSEMKCEYEGCTESASHMTTIGLVERIYLCEEHHILLEFIKRVSKVNPNVGTRRSRLSGPKNRVGTDETKKAN